MNTEDTKGETKDGMVTRTTTLARLMEPPVTWIRYDSSPPLAQLESMDQLPVRPDILVFLSSLQLQQTKKKKKKTSRPTVENLHEAIKRFAPRLELTGPHDYLQKPEEGATDGPTVIRGLIPQVYVDREDEILPTCPTLVVASTRAGWRPGLDVDLAVARRGMTIGQPLLPVSRVVVAYGLANTCRTLYSIELSL